ncbi:Glycoprotein hormones alpha chain [Bienertia sinuspersici]
MTKSSHFTSLICSHPLKQMISCLFNLPYPSVLQIAKMTTSYKNSLSLATCQARGWFFSL